jgi:transposase
VAAARTQWKLDQPALDARRLIFVDETWAKTNMTRACGRAPVGERLIARVPHGHWKTTTLIAALGLEGMACSTVADGAVDGDLFEAFVREVLAAQLRPGDVVILDNLSSHKLAAVRQLIEARGAQVRYLPSYSPDLNPIELIFAKIKQALRSLACRTRQTLWAMMQSVLDQIRPADARHCFAHCGYTLHSE